MPVEMDNLVINFLCVYFQPPKVKAFIDRVINITLHDIAIPLSGFRWDFSKVMIILLLHNTISFPLLCLHQFSLTFNTHSLAGKFSPLEASLYALRYILQGIPFF
jgi:hypothetical protein